MYSIDRQIHDSNGTPFGQALHLGACDLFEGVNYSARPGLSPACSRSPTDQASVQHSATIVGRRSKHYARVL